MADVRWGSPLAALFDSSDPRRIYPPSSSTQLRNPVLPTYALGSEIEESKRSRVVPEKKAFVVERFGKYLRVLDSGLHFLIPLVLSFHVQTSLVSLIGFLSRWIESPMFTV